MARAHEGDVLFFGVAWHGSEKESREYIDEFDVPYDSGLDKDEKVYRAYGFNYQPATVFITKAGRIHRSHFGALEGDEFDAAVRDLLKQG